MIDPSKKENVIKRTIKDSVFTDLFGDSKYLIKLYRALHPEDTETSEQDITDVTIANVLTDNQYNDLGFRIGDTLLVLIEAQSTWSVNIIIRVLMYLMQTYNQYFKDIDADLYGSKRVRLPKPELYVIYTGDRKGKPDEITLKDEFWGGSEAAIDAKVKIIYDGQPGDIINQYVAFTRICQEQIALHGRTQEAIEATIRLCKDRDVLTEYLEAREKEVINIMVALYDEQEIMERYVRNKIKREVAKEVEKEVAKEVAKKVEKELAKELAKATEDVTKEIKESSIRTAIDEGKFFGATIDDTVKRIASKFDLSEEDALTKVNQYW